MSTPIICHYSPKGGVDDRITEYLEDNNIDRQYIGSLRAIYDEYHIHPLIPEGKLDSDITELDIANYASELMTFKHKLTNMHLKELQDTTQHVAKTFVQLYKVEGWDATVRQDRINNIANLFTLEISRLQKLYLKKGLTLSRQDIANGYKENGKYYFGQAKVFENVFNTLLNRWKEDKGLLEDYDDMLKHPDFYEATAEELIGIQNEYNKIASRMEEYPKIFKNWSALCTFARIRLRDIEGLKLGATLKYASEATPDNFILNTDFEDLYNEEESIRESWQVMQEELSSFGSLGKETRKFLSGVKQVDSNGSGITDDMGFTKYENPITLHQKLSEVLRGVTSESGLIRKLWELSTYNTQLKEVFHNLAVYAQVKLNDDSGNLIPISENNKPGYPVLITQLLEDLHKNFVPYSAIVRKGANLYAKILNKQDNPLRGEFALRVEASQVLPGEEFNSIYNKDGRMNFSNYMNFIEEANRLIPNEQRKTVKGKLAENENKTKFFFDTVKNYGDGEGFWSKNFTKTDRISYLVRASRAMGIPLDTIGAMSIYDNPIKRKEYLSQIQEFAYRGFRSIYHTNAEFTSRDIIFNYLHKDSHTSEETEAYNNAVVHLKNVLDKYSYRQFLDATYGFEGNEKKGFANEAAGKLLDIVADATVNLKEERRVSWYDKKGKTTSRYSDRTPCYMGDMVDKIHAFVQEGDALGLRNFIMDKWGSSTFFYNKETGTWRNKWLEELYNSIQTNKNGSVTIKQDSLAKLFGYNEFLGSDFDGKHKIFENFSSKQHACAMLLQYVQAEGNSYNTQRRVSRYPCFILGDSGKQMFFTSRHYKITEVEDFIRKEVLEQEFERIKYVKATNEILLKFFADQYGYKYTDEVGNELRNEDTGRLILKDSEGNIIDESRYKELGYRPVDNFSQTEEEFTMLPFLNKDFENGKYWRILTGNNKEELSDAELVKLSKREAMDMAVNSTSAYRHEAITTYLRDSFEKFLNTLEKLDIINKVVDPKTKELSTRDYADLYNEVKDSRTYNVYKDKTGYFGDKIKGYRDITHLLMDFFYNTKFATIEQIQMFTVDPAFYNHNYPIKDLQKRYKEIYAPGKGVSLEARDYNGYLYSSKNYQSAAYFDDITVNSEMVNPMFMNMIEQQFGKDSYIYKLYTDNTMTDGQGYRSLDSYRAIKGMAGEWTIPMERAYKQIKEIRSKGSLNSEDITKLASLMVFFQPIKPYLYTLEKVRINNSGDTVLIPVQHKYAEIVLIPELMQDGKLKDLALWMENHKDENGESAPIDLVVSTKAVKVGAFGSVPLKGKDDTAAIYDTMNKAYIHKLSLSDYRIQSGVPEHLNHGQLVGTQIRKVFFSNINREGNYSHYLTKIFGDAVDKNNPTIYVPGLGKTHLNGRALISFYNSLIMAGMIESYENFQNEVGNSKSLSDKMIQNVISNANQNEDNIFAFSIIDAPELSCNKEFMVPLGDPGLEHDSSSLLFSLFRNYIIKQRIKGGSAVQASAMGLSGRKAADSGNLYEIVDKDNNGNYNVLYDEVEMPFNLSYTSSFGKNISLDFNDWCNLDGSLKMSKEVVYKDGSDKYKEFLSWPVSGRDEHGNVIDEDKGYQIPLIEKYYPGILNIIAYRIPTERAYSILNCKVVRFSHPEAGGVMKVPSSRTTTAGFDFDIDKLYFFMKEFRQKELDKQTISDIWNDIYKHHPEVKNALLNAYKESVESSESKSTMAAQLQKFRNEGKIDAPDYLYKYWNKAELKGTAEKYFYEYILKHQNKYADMIHETYNPNISPMENTKAARNNLFIDLFKARLQSPETLKARYTPGGFRGNSDAALKMRILKYADSKDITTNGRVDFNKVQAYADSINKKERLDPEPLYDVSDPTTILIYNQQNQIAGKLIGIFANENTNHIFSSALHKLNIKESIQFGDLVKHPKGLNDLLHAPEGIDVDTNVAEYLAASVDAVKDPVLNYLNLNSITADAGALLARLGYTPYEIGLLFNQPIIKKMCEYVVNNDTFIDYAYNTVLLETFGNKISFKLNDIKTNLEQLNSSVLANNIVNMRNVEGGLEKASFAFKMGQVQVLKLFKDILAITKDLNSFVQSSRFTASNSVGSTWGDFYNQKYRVDDYSKKLKKNKSKIIIELYDPEEIYSASISDRTSSIYDSPKDTKILDTNDALLNLYPEEYMAKVSLNPYAFEQCAYDIKRKAVRDIFSKYYPFDTNIYEAARSTIKSLTRSDFLNADTINSIHKDFAVYSLSKQRGSLFDGEAMHENTTITNREFYNKVFPIYMQVLKNEFTNNKKYYLETSEAKKFIDLFNFLKSLTIIGNTVSTSEDYKNSIPLLIIKQGVGGMQNNTASDFTSIWAGMANNNNIIHSMYLNMDIPVSKIAEDFYLYNFYKLGYNFNATSTMHLAPTVLKENLRIVTSAKEEGYIDFLNKAKDGKVKMTTNDIILFAKQYIMNHLDNKNLVYTVKGNALSKIRSKAYNSELKKYKNLFTVSSKELGFYAEQFLIPVDKEEGYLAFRPVIAINEGKNIIYYMASNKERFNKTDVGSETMTYVRVFPQGKRGLMIRYFGEEGYTLFNNNKGKFEHTADVKLSDYKNIEEQMSSVDGNILFEESSESPIDYWVASEEKNILDVIDSNTLEKMYKVLEKKYNINWEAITLEDGRPLNSLVEIFQIFDKTDYDSVQLLKDTYQEVMQDKVKTIDEKGEEISPCK